MNNVFFKRFFLLLGLSCFLFVAGCSDEVVDPVVEEPAIEDPIPEDPEENDPGEDPLHPSVALHWEKGQVFFGENDWTECMVGDIPLIISAPHGGRLQPSEIPNRTCPGITTVLDTNTEELAREMARVLYAEYGVRPYVIINRVRRNKVDMNREINEATCGNAEMKKLWHQYHAFVDTALHTAVAHHGRAYFIDLHAHGHAIQRLELGYLLSTNDLRNISNNSGISLINLGQKSSYRNLVLRQTGQFFRDMLIGDKAFGTMMANEGFPSVPSKQDPYPNSGELYFTGGHNTRRYTGADYPNVFGMQIEAHNQGVRNSATARTQFSRAFAKVIQEHMRDTMD